MRFKVHSVVAVAALGLVSASLRMGAVSRAAANPAPIRLEDENEKRAKEIPALRDIRTQLTDIKKKLDNDVIDPKGYRHKAIDDLQKAIDEISAEISEYKGDEGK